MVELSQVFGIAPPLPGYGVQDMQWEMPVSLDGQTATLYGTIQQVYQQLLKINPQYETEFGSVKKRSVPIFEKNRDSPETFKRDDALTACGHFGPAKTAAIWDGIGYLGSVEGSPGEGPGPGVCGQVSRSENSAIWWCNDVSCSSARLATVPERMLGPAAETKLVLDTSALTWTAYMISNRTTSRRILAHFSDIADSAKTIVEDCSYWSSDFLEMDVSGQDFHADKWNTIVRREFC